MSIVGTLLKNRRAGQSHLAWNLPALAGPETLNLRSPAFSHEGKIPRENAGGRVGGQNISPALSWSSPPRATAQLLLIVEDVDAPTPKPFVHCVALMEPDVPALSPGSLAALSPTPGVQSLRSSMGRGYLGPEPIKGHGPHRYVFQLFALPSILSGASGSSLGSARPREVIAAVRGPALARGRLDGFYER